MRAAASFALLTLLLAGCVKRPLIVDSTTKPTDAMPIVVASIESAMELSYLGGELARDKKDLPGCVVGHSLAAALASTSEGLRGNLKGGQLPGVEYDVSGCLAIAKERPQGAPVPASVGPLIEVGLAGVQAVVNAYGSQLKCEQLAWANAGLTYARGAAPAILAEVASPDGKLIIPSVPVALEACEED